MELPGRVDHLIVGAGFAGLCAAIKLVEDGETDVVVIERADDVGGTWRDNTYPGACCDIPSQLYSFSFARNPEWSSSYSPQPEIQAYLRQVAERYAVTDRIVFGTELEQATWDDDAQVWRCRTTAGDVVARTLITGTGGLSEPRLPEIDGLETFAGAVFHSARWDHSVDLAGTRVAVIGTGASAIQIVPELQKVASRLDVYQRTAPWVIPRNDRRYTRLERLALRRVPALSRLYRTGIYWAHEGYVPMFTWQPRLGAPAQKAAMINIRHAIEDPGLRAKVTPTFRLGCKRVLRSNTYYPALAAENVDLVTDPIARVTPVAIVTADGVEHPVDVIVIATGFWTTELPVAERVVGRRGRTLAEEWSAGGMSAYKGTTVHGFPNLFMLTGPNTGQGHSSVVFTIESQVAYLRDALRTMREQGYAAVEPRAAAQGRWNANLQRRMKRTVWSTGGCSSWYLDAHGRNTVLWPKSTFTFRRRLARFDAEAYDLQARSHDGRVTFELGDPVRIEMEKWGGRPHWHIPGSWLGSDEHGDWIGIPAGTRMVRPGMEIVSTHDQVGLVPSAELPDGRRGWLATFHAQGAPTSVYVDMTTPPVWDGAVVRAVDLDLDVIRRHDGTVVVDDEDEFAEHRVELGYPDDVVTLAETTRELVHAAVRDRQQPFDDSHRRWLTGLAGLTARR